MMARFGGLDRRLCAAAPVAALVSALGAFLVPATAVAESMDPALSRLFVGPCRTQNGEFAPLPQDPSNPDPRGGACRPDNTAFKKLVNQYGFALAPSAMYSARTTGYGGFQLSLQALYTKIDSDADYMKRGTRGPKDPSTNEDSIINNDPASLLQLYSIVMRKGFGFGVEVGGQFGFMPDTSLLSGGADVRISLLEGFREGFAGVLPDFAVGGGVRTITGISDLQLTIASADAVISKPITIKDSSVLTPWVGYQYLWIFGDSGVIDLTPATDAAQYCGYVGPNVPGNPPDPDTSARNGEPICEPDGSGNADFNNNVVFDPARLERQRFLVGLNYRYEMIMAGAQFMMDFVPVSNAQNDEGDQEILEDEDKQWSFALQLGTAF